MNVEFGTKIASDCFLRLVREPQHKEGPGALLPLVVKLMATHMPSDLRTGDYVDATKRVGSEPGRPNWFFQTGSMAKLVVNARFEDVTMRNGLPMTRRFDFAVYVSQVDRIGVPGQTSDWSWFGEGVLVNCGDNLNPQWAQSPIDIPGDGHDD